MLPKAIWMLWLQGWGEAPAVARASLASWRRHNPGWRVAALDAAALRALIPDNALDDILATTENTALSDRVRIELLFRHGGVWADATTICARPLDDWLPHHMQSGFFAFERPTQDRMLASWFLAAPPAHHLVALWRDAVQAYWRGRAAPHDYFWFHHLFAQQYEASVEFRALWDATPKVASRHAFHFGPDDPRLIAPPTPAHLKALEAGETPPVLKLTYKIETPAGSLFNTLIEFGHGR